MEKMNMDRSWHFALENPNGARWGKVNDADWRLIDLPHDWSIELPRSSENPSGVSGGYFTMGTGWYRKVLDAREEWRGKKVTIEFEGVYMNAGVWLNENFLGTHPYGYTGFGFDLTPYLKFGEKNELKVSVDNSHQVNSRWYSGSGMYRHVWLRVNEWVHVAPMGVYVTTPEIDPGKAIVQIQTRLVNETEKEQDVRLTSRVVAPDNSSVGEGTVSVKLAASAESEQTRQLVVDLPLLWSPDSPNLYRLITIVEADGKLVDQQQTLFGIRKIEFNAELGFRLNGVALKLKGGCVHHDHGVLGSAAFDRAEERKVEIHKASGYNAIRCAHNPPSRGFLDACDRLGMLVMDEAFDCWRQGKNPGDYHLVFDDWWQRDVDLMVQRDRNHPSIIMWSIGNEVLERDGRSAGAKIARALAERVRAGDATRPVISAICGVWDAHAKWEDTDEVFAALDVGGYNYQLKNYRSDHDRHPQRMMIGTESTAMEAFDHWMAVEELPYVLGDFIWTSLDYLGESGIGRVHFDGDKGPSLGVYPWHQANCGDLDLCGFKRPQSYYRDILWKTGSPLYLAVHTPVPEGKTPKITFWGWPDVHPSWNWSGHEGKILKVDVYSACDEVELFINKQSLGIQPSGKTDKFTASFEVAYAPGELKAVGLIGGKPAAEMALHTAGAPASIRLSPDRAQLHGGIQDLSYVTVELLDADGVLCQNADRPVYFSVQGTGGIVAVGNANPVSTEAYTGNVRATYYGRCLVVVKAGDQAGGLHLRAQADGVFPAEIVLKVG